MCENRPEQQNTDEKIFNVQFYVRASRNINLPWRQSFGYRINVFNSTARHKVADKHFIY